MKNGWMCVRVLLLFVAIFLGSISNVKSQDLFREMDQIKKEVTVLRK